MAAVIPFLSHSKVTIPQPTKKSSFTDIYVHIYFLHFSQEAEKKLYFVHYNTHRPLIIVLNKAEWLESPANIKEANKDAKI